MEPEYLNNDIIILEKCSDAENGSDCVVMVNGYEGTFKRIKKSSSGITLLPLNKKYKPMEYSVQDIQNLPIRIIGKVVELRRRK
jgi:repressor LexA